MQSNVVFRLRNVWTLRHMEIVRSVGKDGVRELTPGERPQIGDVADTCKGTMLKYLAQFGLRLGEFRACSKTFPVIAKGK